MINGDGIIDDGFNEIDGKTLDGEFFGETVVGVSEGGFIIGDGDNAIGDGIGVFTGENTLVIGLGVANKEMGDGGGRGLGIALIIDGDVCIKGEGTLRAIGTGEGIRGAIGTPLAKISSQSNPEKNT